MENLFQRLGCQLAPSDRAVFAAHFGQSRHEVRGPPVHGLFRDDSLHPPYPLQLLPDGHFQRPDERRNDLLRVIRIDPDGVGQLHGCSGHFAEDQYARIAVLDGDVLLGHEVHAVAQRSDQSYVGDVVHGRQLLERKAVVEIADRRPVHRGVAAVDGADLLVDAGFQVGVGADPVARGNDHHRQRHLAQVFGMLFQKGVESVQTVADALAVIEPVNRKHQFSVAEVGPRAGDQLPDGRRGGDPVELFVVDAHRQGIDPHETVADLGFVEFEIHVQDPFRRADEVAHVVVRVEGDQVGAQHTPQQFGPFGQNPEQFVAGERDVVEIADAERGHDLAEHAGQQHELVILHPDDVVGTDQVAHLLAEEPVDFAVAFPEILPVLRVGEEIVAQGPDRAVAVPFVVVFDLFPGEEHGMEVQFFQLFTDVLPVLGFFHVEPRPADPVFFVLGLQ